MRVAGEIAGAGKGLFVCGYSLSLRMDFSYKRGVSVEYALYERGLNTHCVSVCAVVCVVVELVAVLVLVLVIVVGSMFISSRMSSVQGER